jgi:hypothetical protein
MYLHSFITSPLVKVSDQIHSLISLTLEKEPTVPKIRRLDVPQSQFKHVEEGTKHLPPTRNESSSPQPSQYAGCYLSSLNSYNFTIFPRGTSVTEHFSPPLQQMLNGYK